MPSNLSELSGAPQMNLVTSLTGAAKAGVNPLSFKGAFVDAYNQAQMAKYNNEYNYWLWQQQAEYNKPSNQVARLKEAGLNPNFNSIEGAGNLGSMPSSSGSITPSIGRNVNARAGNVISSVNSLIQGVSQGVDSFKTLSDTPRLQDLSNYRDLLYKTARSQMRDADYRQFRQMIGSVIDTLAAGGNLPEEFEIPSPFMVDSLYNDGSPAQSGFITISPKQGAAFERLFYQALNSKEDNAIKRLVSAAKSYYNENIQPKEKEIIEGKAGMSAIGKALEKFTSGEHIGWRDIIALVAAGLASKLL